MTLPLQILGVLSVVGGFIGFPGQLFHHPEWNKIEGFLEPVMLKVEHGEGAGHPGLGLEFLLIALSLAVAGFGIWLAYRFYMGDEAGVRPRRLAERFPFAHRALENKYWVDELYDSTVIRPVHRMCLFAWKVVDVVIIDTLIVNGSAFLTELTGDFLRFLQTGNVRNYALSVALGILVLAVILW